jgi:hypothetical protein
MAVIINQVKMRADSSGIFFIGTSPYKNNRLSGANGPLPIVPS